MKESVQIKAALVVGQHDALIEFYGRYNRLFVNKLLLKLCEGLIADYEPNLALFHSNDSAGAAVARKVAIRIEKDKHPKMWEFYKDLPYGSRTMVIVNLLTHYATLAEADPAIMENTYWSRRPDATHQVSAEPAVHLVGKTSAESKEVAGVQHVPVQDAGASRSQDGEASAAFAAGRNAEPAVVEDPLSGFSTGL